MLGIKRICMCIFMIVSMASCAAKKNKQQTKVIDFSKEENLANVKVDIQVLKSFCTQDDFNNELRRPYPKKTPQKIYDYAKNNYQGDRRVRALLANYFLDYDYICLKLGFMDFAKSDGNLINILIDFEQETNTRLKESASLSYIRDHIQKKSSWFYVSRNDHTKLNRNWELLKQKMRQSTR